MTTTTPTQQAAAARAWIEATEPHAYESNDPAQFQAFGKTLAVFSHGPRLYFCVTTPQSRRPRIEGVSTNDIRPAVRRWIDMEQAKAERQQARKDAKRQARETFTNPYKPGDILYSSWGYEQTNREFYQVIETGPRSILIREVSQDRNRDTAGMISLDSGQCAPRPGDFIGDSKWVTLQIRADGSHHVPSPIHGYLYRHDGRPLYWSDGH